MFAMPIVVSLLPTRELAVGAAKRFSRLKSAIEDDPEVSASPDKQLGPSSVSHSK